MDPPSAPVGAGASDGGPRPASDSGGGGAGLPDRRQGHSGSGGRGGSGVGGSSFGGDPSRLLRHLRREDRHTDAVLAAAGVTALKQRLLAEMRDLYLGHTQEAPPERLGPHFYSVRTGQDGGLLEYVRRPAGRSDPSSPSSPRPGPAEQVLLNRSIVAADAALACRMTGLRLGDAVGAVKLCPAHRLMAYSLPVLDRHDVYCVLVRDADTGKLLAPGGVVGGVAGPGGMELAADGRSLLVTVPDRTGRPSQVVLYDMRCAAAPRLLLSETDPRFFLALGRTKDWAFLLISSNSKTSSEVHLLAAACPGAHPPRLVQPRRPGLEYFVEHYAAPRPETAAGPGPETARRPDRVGHVASQGMSHSASDRTTDLGLSQYGRSSAGCRQSQDPDPGAARGQVLGRGQGQLIILTNADPAEMGRAAGGGRGGGGLVRDGDGLRYGSDVAATSPPGGGEGDDGGGGGGGVPSCGRELRVVVAPVEGPGIEQWRPLVPERPGVVITDMDMFADRCVLYERRNGLPAISVLPLPPPSASEAAIAGGGDGGGGGDARAGSSPIGGGDGGDGSGSGGGVGSAHLGSAGDSFESAVVQVPLPPWALHVTPGANADPLSPTLRLTLAGPLHPPATFDYHFDTHCMQLLSYDAPPPAAQELLRHCSLAHCQLEVGAEAEAEGKGEVVAQVGANMEAEAVGCSAASPMAGPSGGDGASYGSGDRESGVAGGAQREGGAGGGGVAGAGGRRRGGRRVPGPVAVPVTLLLPPGVEFPSSSSWPPSSPSSFSWRLLAHHKGGDYEPQPHPDPDPDPDLAAKHAAPAGAAAAADEARARAAAGPPHADRFLWAAAPGPRPVVLSVYGAYGMPLELQYDPTLLCMLARGWAVARVHVRGGGELGRSWHAAGVRRLKRAGVEDCLAAVKALVAAGVTAPGLVAGHAVSAGGIVLGAALNADPGVWGAAVLRCSFLELLTSCSDRSQPLAPHEWDEWGDPEDPGDWAAMRALCPYNNLNAYGAGTAAAVPGGCGGDAWRAAVLASCAEEDPRVHPGIPAKWVARLRDQLRTQEPDDGAREGAHDGRNDDGDGDRDSGNYSCDDGSEDERAPEGLLGRLWARLRVSASRGGGGGGGEALGKPRGGGLTGSRGGEGGADGAAERCGEGSGDGKLSVDGDAAAGLGAETGPRPPPPPPLPLLRVHSDGTGHVREGTTHAEEVAEEMAFLLVAVESPGGGANKASQAA